MLFVVMYHHAGTRLPGNPPAVLRAHFDWIRHRHAVVLPGEPLPASGLSVCLTFDDAYADFYAHVYPMLREHGLRAVLAVPTAFVLEHTSIPMEDRLSVPHGEAMREDVIRDRAPFCTWMELREMVASGHVMVASHSATHPDMTQPTVDLASEVSGSKAVIESKLNCPVSVFVYPYGKADARSHAAVTGCFTHAMRIGGAVNRDWSSRDQPLCRVGGDGVDDPSALFARIWHFRAKRLVNQARVLLGKWRVR